MIFAKVNGTTVIKYPYTMDSLREENPYTNYGDNNSVEYWYPMTEDAVKTGCSLVEVELLPKPEVSDYYKIAIQDFVPKIVNNKWVLDWTIFDKTEDQKQQSRDELIFSLNELVKGLINGSGVFYIDNTQYNLGVSVENQSTMSNLILASDLIPNFTCILKGANGEFYTLSQSDLKTLYIKIFNYIQACLQIEKEVKQKIQLDQVTSFKQIGDDFPWPYKQSLGGWVPEG